MDDGAATTWFYAMAADGTFHSVKRDTAKRVLAGGMRFPRIPREWRDINGALTLIGVGLILENGKPAYIDRWAVSHHGIPALSHSQTPQAAPGVDLEALAGRILSDAAPHVGGVRALVEFLAKSRHEVLLDDLYVWMQEGRASLDPFWVAFLAAGRQSYALWDLRNGRPHPPRTPLVLRSRRHAPRERRPTRPTR